MKKFLIGCFLLLTMLSFHTIAFATDGPSVNVSINTNQTKAESTTTVGKYKYYAGLLDPSSKRKLYFNAKRSSGNSFVTDNYKLLDIGDCFDNKKTNVMQTSVIWKLELNPYGVSTKGCFGEGWMWYLQ